MIIKTVTTSLRTVALRSQPAAVTWFAPAIVPNIAAVQMRSTSITIRGLVALRHRVARSPRLVSALGYPRDAISKFAVVSCVCPSAKFNLYFSDSVVTRVLGHGMNVVGQVSIETCTTACFNAGYTLAGAEYADECCELFYPLFSYASLNE